MFLATGLTLLYSHAHPFQYGLKNLGLCSFSVDYTFSTSEEGHISAQLIKL